MCVHVCTRMCACMRALCVRVCVQAAIVATVSQHVYCYYTEARMPHRPFMKTYLFILETPSLLVHYSLAISGHTATRFLCTQKGSGGNACAATHSAGRESLSVLNPPTATDRLQREAAVVPEDKTIRL